MRIRREHVLLLLLVANFAIEIVHGILTRQFGTDAYAPITPGEIVRGLALLLLVADVLTHPDQPGNRFVLLGLAGLALLTAIQGLVFIGNAGETAQTLLRGLRWLYLFIVIGFVARQLARAAIPQERAITTIKWLVVLFYCLPIYLAAANIVGYATYDGNRGGFVGFVMNNNVVAGLFVMLLPFYLRIDRRLDYLLLALFVPAGLLLGAKVVYGAWAITFAIWLLLQIQRTSRIFLRSGTATRRTLAVPLGGVAGLVLAIATGLVDRLGRIWFGFQDVFSVQLAWGRSFFDVLTSQRNYSVIRYFDWAADPANMPKVLLGGGAPNYRLLYGEVDWTDLLALFGVVGLIALYGTLIVLLAVVWNARLPYQRETAGMIALALLVSAISGHTFDGPVTGITVGYIFGVYFSPILRCRPQPVPLRALVAT